MAKNARKAAAVVLMMLMGATPAAADDERQTLVLSIDNQCLMPLSVLQEAQAMATAIYEGIRVRLVWSRAGAVPLPKASVSLQLWIRLTDRAERLLSIADLSKKMRPKVLGVAPAGTQFAYLFCRRIAQVAARGRLERALGRAIAHEVGHLLLPELGHSETGIMGASLDFTALESPGFTEAQGDSIRAFLMASK